MQSLNVRAYPLLLLIVVACSVFCAMAINIG
jgi:hypothetical protein